MLYGKEEKFKGDKWSSFIVFNNLERIFTPKVVVLFIFIHQVRYIDNR